MSLTRTQIGGLFMLILSASYGFLIFDIPVIANNATLTARSMPTFLAVLGTCLAMLLLTRRHPTPGTHSEKMNFKLGLLFLILMSAYGFAIRPVGFVLATIVFLYTGFWLLGERNRIKNLMIAVPLVAIFWWMMVELLGVYLPALPEFLYD